MMNLQLPEGSSAFVLRAELRLWWITSWLIRNQLFSPPPSSAPDWAPCPPFSVTGMAPVGFSDEASCIMEIISAGAESYGVLSLE